jgi:hypothetical protein
MHIKCTDSQSAVVDSTQEAVNRREADNLEEDEIVEMAGSTWTRLVTDREEWRGLGEVFVGTQKNKIITIYCTLKYLL